MKTQEIHELLTTSWISNIEYDWQEDDRRLHCDNIFSWYELEEKDYVAMEKAIEESHYKWKWFEIYCWCDVSWFDYRTISQEEHNYISVSILFDDDFVGDEETIQEIVENRDNVTWWAESELRLNMNWIH